MIAASGTTAGATLMPMVMKAQIMAAKVDKICVRACWVMLNSFSGHRTTPAMRGTMHGPCQNERNPQIPYVWYFWLLISIGIFSLVGK